MSDLIVHIGFGKTGTSSLQEYLSFHGVDRIDDTNFCYASWSQDGRFIFGNALKEAAIASPHRYVVSTPSLPSSFRGLVEGILKLKSMGLVPILSQEDWARTGAILPALEQLKLKATVISYIRPQVEWFNAGWWQWWTWINDFNHPEDVLRAWSVGFLHWARQLSRWHKSPSVETLVVRLHCKDVVEDFIHFLGGSVVTRLKRHNTSLDPLILKLYKSIPNLREKYNAEIDSVLSPILSKGRRAPWVLSRKLVKQIILDTWQDNKDLLQYLNPEQRNVMSEDHRWWDVKAYESRFNEGPLESMLSRDEAVEILKLVIPIVIDQTRGTRM